MPEKATSDVTMDTAITATIWRETQQESLIETEMSFLWNFVIESCHIDNFRLSLWWEFRQNDNISVSVLLMLEPECFGLSMSIPWLRMRCFFASSAMVLAMQDKRAVFHIVYTKHDDVIKWKHFPRYWPFVRVIHRSPVNSPHKGQWRGALMFSSICAWMNGWVNNREAGYLRRHRDHYDVTVMTMTWLTLYVYKIRWPVSTWDRLHEYCNRHY